MDEVYLLTHGGMWDGECEVKILGVYRSEDSAKNAIELLSQKEGFIDYKDEFFIEKWRLDETEWMTGFTKMNPFREK